MKVIVVHPGKQHAYHVARELHKKGILYGFYNRGYFKTKFIDNKVICSFPGLKKTIDKRNEKNIPDHLVNNTSFFTFFILKLIAKYFSIKFYQNILYRLNYLFQKRIAKKLIREDFDVLISYDTASYHLFSVLKKKKPSVKLVLDVSNPHVQGYNILLKENDKPDQLIQDKTPDYPLVKNIFSDIIKEQLLADHLLAASTFTKACLIKDGVVERKISVLPYGFDENFGTGSSGLSREIISDEEPLRFLFVGRITCRKGISYLLPAFHNTLKTNNNIRLQVIGNIHQNDLYLNEYQHPDIEFTGHVSNRDTLKEIFLSNHIFILPTLADGFGFVYLEAMQMGLPIIGTTNSGAGDLIKHKENGYLIKPHSIEEIEAAIFFFIKNKKSLPEYSLKAQKTVAKYTWDRYGTKLYDTLNAIVNEKG